MMHGIMNWRLNNPINKLVYILDIFYVLYDSYNDIYIASSIFDVIQIVMYNSNLMRYSTRIRLSRILLDQEMRKT
jgi:energy-converting hydrogenase Eha subunit C